jgi:hypothetical protein
MLASCSEQTIPPLYKGGYLKEKENRQSRNKGAIEKTEWKRKTINFFSNILRQ